MEKAKAKPQDRRLYHKIYYDCHKDEIRERRKQKYAEDPEYREEVKRRWRDWWARTHIPTDPTMVIDEKGKKYFSISHLSDAINRKVNTIQRYHALGVLPEATYFSTRGWRLYTIEQMNLLGSLFMEVDDKVISLKEMTALAKKEWRKCA